MSTLVLFQCFSFVSVSSSFSNSVQLALHYMMRVLTATTDVHQLCICEAYSKRSCNVTILHAANSLIPNVMTVFMAWLGMMLLMHIGYQWCRKVDEVLQRELTSRSSYLWVKCRTLTTEISSFLMLQMVGHLNTPFPAPGQARSVDFQIREAISHEK